MGVSVQFSNKSQAARPRVSLFVLRRGLIPGWCWCRAGAGAGTALPTCILIDT